MHLILPLSFSFSLVFNLVCIWVDSIVVSVWVLDLLFSGVIYRLGVLNSAVAAVCLEEGSTMPMTVHGIRMSVSKVYLFSYSAVPS